MDLSGRSHKEVGDQYLSRVQGEKHGEAMSIDAKKILVAVTRALKLLVGLFERIIRGEDI